MVITKIKYIIPTPSGKGHILIYDCSQNDNEYLKAIFGKFDKENNFIMKGELKLNFKLPSNNEKIFVKYEDD